MAFTVTQGANPRSFSTSRPHLTSHAQGHWPSTFFRNIIVKSVGLWFGQKIRIRAIQRHTITEDGCIWSYIGSGFTWFQSVWGESKRKLQATKEGIGEWRWFFDQMKLMLTQDILQTDTTKHNLYLYNELDPAFHHPPFIQPKRGDGEENHKRRPMPPLFQLHDTRSLQPPSPTSEKFCPLASHPLSPQSECLRSGRGGVPTTFFDKDVLKHTAYVLSCFLCL